MFYIISLAMLIVACFNQNNTLMMTSGLFAIAGSVEFLRATKSDKKENKDE